MFFQKCFLGNNNKGDHMATRTNFPSRIEKRKETAKARQEASDKLTVEQKLANARPGSKEHSKLLAKSEK